MQTGCSQAALDCRACAATTSRSIPARRYRERPGRLRGDPRRRRRARHRAGRRRTASSSCPAAASTPARALLARAAPRMPRGDRLAHRASIRRLGALQRFAYMPEYDLWARKVCHVYLARPVRRLGAAVRARPPRDLDADPDRARPAATAGDRAFLAARVRPPARSSSARARSRNRARSAGPNGRPPPCRNGSAARRSAIRSRIASRSPTFARGERRAVRRQRPRAPLDAARRQRHVGGHADVARPDPLGDPACRPRRRPARRRRPTPADAGSAGCPPLVT